MCRQKQIADNNTNDDMPVIIYSYAVNIKIMCETL